MQISVTSRHMETKQAIKKYAVEKVEHTLSEFPRVLYVHAILDIQKYRHIAEIVVQAKDHIQVDAQHESDDLYVSIDGAVDKATKQLRRLRDKVQDHRSREKLADIELATEAKNSYIEE